MTWTLIIALILFGLILLVLEALVLPGAISGIIGFILIVVATWQAFATFGTKAGLLLLLGILLMSTLLIILVFRSKTWNKVTLHSKVEGKSGVNTNIKDLLKIGDKGVAISRIAPMGKAKINNEYFEVSSLGEFIDNGNNIEVINIENNKIFVKQIKID